MTDLHCHILPGIDDGAKNEKESLELIGKEYNDGVRNIALTSHYNPEGMELDDYLHKREKAFVRLQKAVLTNNLACCLNYKLGAEVFFSPKLCEMDVRKLCLEGTGFLLLEFPLTYQPYFINETFYHLQSMGIVPIVAHIERYDFVMKKPQILYDWVAAGCLAQVNADTILKNRKYKRLIYNFIKWDLVQILASDAHSMKRRPPNLGQGFAKLQEKMGEDIVKRLMDNSDCIFEGIIPDTMDIHCPKKFLGRWI